MKILLALIGIIVGMLSLHVNAGEISHGQELFERRCSGCHGLDRDKEGPRLRGVYGRASASTPSFSYSDALKKARITWDGASIDRWLADPEKMVPETDMAFRVTDQEERKQLVAYLKALSASR